MPGGRGHKKIITCGIDMSANDAAPLKYKVETSPGKWSIDTDKISALVDAYTADADGKRSISGLMIALGIKSLSTLSLWRQGYTSEAMRDNTEITYNQPLSDAVTRGVMAVAQYYEERNDKYSTQKDIMALKTLGIYSDSQDININVIRAKSDIAKRYGR